MAEARSDPLGIASLTLGILSVVSLLLVFCTCGISLFGTALLALVGGGLALGAHGSLKVAGLTLNLVGLLAAVVIFTALTVAGAASPSTSPRATQSGTTTSNW